MLAPTPPMGWNSWNTFGASITEDVVRESAEALVDLGLDRAGYRYVVIDDFWEAETRDAQDRLQAHPDRFPSGIPALADRVHALGLKFGIYSCAGTHTCGRQLASYGFETLDAQTFADWGVDFLKYDFCNVPPGVDGPMLYRRMGQALRQTGRDILFSACEWGIQEPWKWARSAGCHMWRTTGDIGDGWGSIKEIGFVRQRGLEVYAGPNGWNDPDMLVVGMSGQGNVASGGCTISEYEVHFVQWCMLAAPLMLGCDVRAMSPETLALVANPRLLAVSQDPLGAQARRVAPAKDEWDWADLPVYAKPLADGSVAVALYNLRDVEGNALMQCAWETLGLDPNQRCRVTDLLTGDKAETSRYVSALVDRHAVKAYRLTPTP